MAAVPAEHIPAGLHPAVKAWFTDTFASPTDVQTQAWAEITKGRHTLIAAPTGSGKTLAGFLAVIDQLVRQRLAGCQSEGTQVVYVSPLKALSNDIERNLQQPLAGIQDHLKRMGLPAAPISVAVRTGDTSPSERDRMRRQPPDILVTTPESLYLLLTADSGRRMLGSARTLIIDEIHALAGNKRGAHLALSMARLAALNPAGGETLQRIGMSATQKPLNDIAAFLTGAVNDCAIVDAGHQRNWDLAVELPPSGLSAVMANEVWDEIYDRLAELIEHHARTTLVFVNTRRLAERVARALEQRLGEDAVTAHHGSLSRKHRLRAEQALKQGELKALVATASLELGIDVGHIDLVCQLGSPRAINAFLQRVGRAGHQVGARSVGRLFPLTRDDLVEGVALLGCVEQGELDRIRIPSGPLDVLSQQVVAEVSAGEQSLDTLLSLVREAWPYRDLTREEFLQVLEMLAEGYATRRGRRGAYIHLDRVNGRVRGRRRARLTALMNGGAIPDQFDYDVVLLPEGHRVGSVNEDFAFESIPGDIFQLGNTSYRIAKVEQGRVLVEDAAGLPPTIPFWFGEAPGRSDELSVAVSGLRGWLSGQLNEKDIDAVMAATATRYGVPIAVARELVSYLAAAHSALDGLPTQDRIVLERFFDDVGDMHLVVHSPFGVRINRAWGLALRKRFCAQFNFELQASALEDSIILSLGETHSFEMTEVPRYLNRKSLRSVLVQALLDAPMFEVRWRWNATVSLAVQRMRNGRRIPPQWQRSAAEDLVAVVFPDQLACLENIRGEREVPDHPLVKQTIEDCLTDVMDLAGLLSLYERIEQGTIEIACADLVAPSPLAQEIITAKPYAFLDDGEAEERRTRAISRQPDPGLDQTALRRLLPDAISQVQREVWPRPRDTDELHDALLQLGFMTGAELEQISADASRHLKQLLDERRVIQANLNGAHWWLAVERIYEFLRIHPDAECYPEPDSPARWQHQPEDAVSALGGLLAARLTGLGPVTLESLCLSLNVGSSEVRQALLSLQQQGVAVRIESGDAGDARNQKWCDRRLLARIHRLSRTTRRARSKAVAPAAFFRFLLHWQHLDEPDQGGLHAALQQLEGWSAPLVVWDRHLLPKRCTDADPDELERLFLGGEYTWLKRPGSPATRATRATPISIVRRADLRHWMNSEAGASQAPELSSTAQRVVDLLSQYGALFQDELLQRSGLLAEPLDNALNELLAQGMVHADGLAALRRLQRPSARRRSRSGRGFDTPAGRWSLLPEPLAEGDGQSEDDQLDTIARALLRRYGVVFRAIIQKENLPVPWRRLLGWLRRLEDRGEVRGGRFVSGFSGEQFALPEAVGLLKRADELATGTQTLHSYDPLNLAGILWPGPPVPLGASNWLELKDGREAQRVVNGHR